MDFDLFLVCYALFDEELSEISSEVSLQLDNETLFLIFDDGAVAMVHFLESTEELLIVQVIGKTLNNGQALSCGTLLIVQI